MRFTPATFFTFPHQSISQDGKDINQRLCIIYLLILSLYPIDQRLPSSSLLPYKYPEVERNLWICFLRFLQKAKCRIFMLINYIFSQTMEICEKYSQGRENVRKGIQYRIYQHGHTFITSPLLPWTHPQGGNFSLL